MEGSAIHLSTKRLRLRPLRAEDAPALAERMGHPEVLKNLGTPPSPFTEAAAREKIAAEAAAAPDAVHFGIFLETGDSEALVGGVGYARRPDRGGETALSYWIAADHQGRGIAVEAGTALLELAFVQRGLPALVARHYADNPQSGRVLEKLGFSRRLPDRYYFSVPRGCDVLCAEYTLSRTDWLDVAADGLSAGGRQGARAEPAK